MKMDCTQKNFPYRVFANVESNECYLFYRQGHVFTVNNANVHDYKFARMTDMDLGQMYLVNNKALIARSSSRILFFKIIVDEENGDRNWTLYNTISLRGFIYYIKGNDRIQITTDKLVYFYGIDQETFEPTLSNVMFNFMNCNQMMFGSDVKYGITYKTN